VSPKAEPFVYADFSSLEKLNRSVSRSRSSFFIETPIVIEPEAINIPLTGIVHNGQMVEFQANFQRKEGGFDAEVKVLSDQSEPNSVFAQFYLNLMFDVASLRHASPFQILSSVNINREAQSRFLGTSTCGIMRAEDFDQSARLSFLYFSYEKDLVRSISWYRRGLSSTDPLFSFLGLWNSIEIASSKFCEKNEKTSNGVKNQIYQAFLDYLPKHSPSVFTDENEMDLWINENYQMRLDIAHGLASSDLKIFERNESLLPKIRRVATIFLRHISDARRNENDMIVRVIKQAEAKKEPTSRATQ
jgi:hypothetical protein